MRPLPSWLPCPPPRPGVYFTFSEHEERRDLPGLGQWDGQTWQMHLGWYDHGITHYMETDFNGGVMDG